MSGHPTFKHPLIIIYITQLSQVPIPSPVGADTGAAPTGEMPIHRGHGNLRNLSIYYICMRTEAICSASACVDCQDSTGHERRA